MSIRESWNARDSSRSKSLKFALGMADTILTRLLEAVGDSLEVFVKNHKYDNCLTYLLAFAFNDLVGRFSFRLTLFNLCRKPLATAYNHSTTKLSVLSITVGNDNDWRLGIGLDLIPGQSMSQKSLRHVERYKVV